MNTEFWEKAKNFHGHECPGLAIGVRACEAAVEKLKIAFSADEELVCITENNACGVDAVQVLTGCTLGKGNLIYHPRGKQAFTFISREKNLGFRFYLKAKNNGMERAGYQNYLLTAPLGELFSVSAVTAPPPEKARIFKSVVCECCNESAAEEKIRLQDGKKVCLDCFIPYTRGR